MEFTYTVPTNTFFAPTKAEANAIAQAAAYAQAPTVKFCCDFPEQQVCVNVPYDQSFDIEQGAEPFRVSFPNVGLPDGLQMELTNGGRTIRIHGTPTTPGNTNVLFHITDGRGTVVDLPVYFLCTDITTGNTLPNGNIGVLYSESLAAIGGSGSYYFQVTAGTLPPGLTLSPGGQILGVPTTAGTYLFEVSLTDQAIANPSVASMGAVLEPALCASAYEVARHSYQMNDFATLFATLPSGLAVPSGGVPVWNAHLGDAVMPPILYNEVGIGFGFPDGTLAPSVAIYAYDQDGNYATPGVPIAFWRLFVWYRAIVNACVQTYRNTHPAWKYEDAYNACWPLLWSGIHVTHNTHPDGIYTREGGLMTMPEIVISQLT